MTISFHRIPHRIKHPGRMKVTHRTGGSRPDSSHRIQVPVCRQTLPYGYFRVARDPSRIDASCGDRFLQADLSLLIYD